MYKGDIVYIYALLDPITYDVRYVGKTKNMIVRRSTHKSAAKNCSEYIKRPLQDWINICFIYGLKPKMKLLQITNSEFCSYFEMFWIEHYSKEYSLFNSKSGRTDYDKCGDYIKTDWCRYWVDNEGFNYTFSSIKRELAKDPYTNIHKHKTAINYVFDI